MKASVSDVKFTLFLALCLVVMVIFLFLRNVRATMIPSLALPMSLVGTFAVMYLLGLQPRQPLADGAHARGRASWWTTRSWCWRTSCATSSGASRCMEAAINGAAGRSASPCISMTLSLVAVFIPVLFLGGLIGRLFQEFAVTIGVAILVSGFVSLTLTPMLCSRWLRPAGARSEHGRFYRVIERAWEALARLVRAQPRLGDGPPRRSRWLFSAGHPDRHRSCWAGSCPRASSRARTQGQLNGTTETAEGTSYDAMVQHQRAAAAIVQEDPNVDGFMSSVGAGGRIQHREPGPALHPPQGPRPARR